MNRKGLFVGLLILVMLITSMFVNVRGVGELVEPPTDPLQEEPPTIPPVTEIPITEPSRPLPEGYPRKMPDTSVVQDADGNRVHDVLDQIILEAAQDNVSSKYVGLYHQTIDGVITDEDIANMERFGGTNISLLGDGDILYGQMPCNSIYDYVASNNRILTVEPELLSFSYSGVAAIQTGARIDAWTTIGTQGDSNSSIAILDSGIDSTHTATLGYGDKDFTKKIVGWYDNATSTTTPFDLEGHGTLTASVAAGNGYGLNTTSGNNLVYHWVTSCAAGYIVTQGGAICTKSGTLKVNVYWYQDSANNVYGQCRIRNGTNRDSNQTAWDLFETFNLTANAWTNTTVTISAFSSINITQLAVGVGLGRINQYASGSSRFYVEIQIPYDASDTYSKLTGIAPLAKLFGSYVPTDTSLINTLAWIRTHKTEYHINVVSMSFGFASRLYNVEAAVNQTVEAGIICVAAGGNNRSGGESCSSPAAAQLCIAVDSITCFDHVANYNAYGLNATSTSPKKPDCVAPGGAYIGGVYVADTNNQEYPEITIDLCANDSTSETGTSIACPVVSGGANLIIDAMGGYSQWNYTKEEALRVKTLILATCTETYPNARLGGSGDNPTQDRDGKDIQEGYGRVNFDAAVDAVLKEYHNGTYWLGASPTENQTTSHIGEPLCWARNYYMTANHQYWFKMTPPDNSDYDLYLCNNTGDKWGEPVWVGKSTNDSDHVEEFYYTPSSSGLCYLIVKRADADSPAGSFFIESADKTTDSRTRYAVANADDYHCELYSSGTYHWDQLYDRGDWNWYETLPISYGNHVAATGDGNTNYDKYWIYQTWNTTNPFYNASGFTATIRAWCRDSSAKYELGNFRLFYWTYDLGFVYSSTFEPPTTYSLYNFTIASFTPWNGTRLNDMFYFGIEMTAGYDERRDIHYLSYCETLYIEISFTGWQYDS